MAQRGEGTENRSVVLRTILTAACVLLLSGSYQVCAANDVTFSRDIQPMLTKQCLLCHGPDEAEGGLRLDVDQQAYAELDSGARAIVPGKPEASELMRRVFVLFSTIG